jgi:Spy/CpxP family protein refolding chaperone
MNQKIRVLSRPATLLTVVLALVPGAAVAQGGKWWQSERFQRELQLTPDQISRIEDVFQSAIPQLREQKQSVDRLEKSLSRLIDTVADEAVVMQEAERVEQARSALSKERTRMLLRMRRLLSAEQRVKLAALHNEWERNRKHQDRRR